VQSFSSFVLLLRIFYRHIIFGLVSFGLCSQQKHRPFVVNLVMFSDRTSSRGWRQRSSVGDLVKVLKRATFDVFCLRP
jgi:hypothetical protein